MAGEGEVRNIVTTEPSSTEMVAYLDQSVERIVGVSDKCDYPVEVISKPKVVRSLVDISEDMSSREIDRVISMYKRSGKPLFEIDWDLIYRLDPDLIVGQTLCDVCAFPLKTGLGAPARGAYTINRFRVIRVAEYSPHSFMAIATEAIRLSRIIDRVSRAESLYHEFKRIYDELEGLGRGVKTAVIEWIDPLYAAGHWVSDLVERSGSRSLLPAGEPGRRIDNETLVKFDPDIIVVAPCGFGIERSLREIDILTHKPWWRKLRAARKGNIYVVDSAYTARPSPRTARFAEFLIDIYTGSQPSSEIAVKLE